MSDVEFGDVPHKRLMLQCHRRVVFFVPYVFSTMKLNLHSKAMLAHGRACIRCERYGVPCTYGVFFRLEPIQSVPRSFRQSQLRADDKHIFVPITADFSILRAHRCFLMLWKRRKNGVRSCSGTWVKHCGSVHCGSCCVWERE